MGRPSIFRDKQGGKRIMAIISQVGALQFETARRRLALLANWPPARVSDADVVEYLARGHDATRVYLKESA
jgi:hypothetical protein